MIVTQEEIRVITMITVVKHPGLAEIPAPDGSQEVVGHTYKC